jgi:hypothetical protein
VTARSKDMYDSGGGSGAQGRHGSTKNVPKPQQERRHPSPDDCGFVQFLRMSLHAVTYFNGRYRPSLLIVDRTNSLRRKMLKKLIGI